MIKSNHNFIKYEQESALKFRSYTLITLIIIIKMIIMFISLLMKTESSCMHVIYCCMLATFDYATVMWLLDECLLSSVHKHSKLLWHSIFLDILSQIFVCICCFTLFLECFDLSLSQSFCFHSQCVISAEDFNFFSLQDLSEAC